MIFRQLFDSESSTYTYLLADAQTREAVVIDPVRERLSRDLSLMEELGLKLTHVLETHVHADHVTSASALRDATGAKTAAGSKGAECLDLRLRHGDVLRVGTITIKALETPGHTDDSLSFLVTAPGEPMRVFTGDALFVRGAGRTDFQNGSAEALYDSLTRVLFSLPDDTLVYPAHDYNGHCCSSIGEERRFNPRVAGKTAAEFVALMHADKLAPPRKLHEAVPANRACGRTPDAARS